MAVTKTGANSPPPVQRYVCTWAQNATPVHAGFLASLRQYCRSNRAKLLVIKGRYRNPTSVWGREEEDSDDWYDERIRRFLVEDRIQLCPNLCLYGDVHTRPTAVRPLSGFEVFCGANSGIFGHPKRALEVIPTATRTPRLLLTTSACTLPNYTDSKAGKKGAAHHVFGALIVEVTADGLYFARHVTASGKKGAFTDLARVYAPDGVYKARPALGLTLGDIHDGRDEPAVLAATERLVTEVRPRHIALHDVLDFKARNHHEKTLKRLFDRHRLTVEEEVQGATQKIRTIAGWGDGTHEVAVIASNHDEAFDRWLDEANPKQDLANAPYYMAVWHRLFNTKAETGEWLPAFELEAKRLGVPKNVRFIRRNEVFKLGDVNYGFHGDKGINGSRGTPHAYAKLGCKTNTAHTHTPCIRDGNFTAGVTAQLDHDYNFTPSTWMNADILHYADGKRTMIIVVDGRYKAA